MGAASGRFPAHNDFTRATVRTRPAGFRPRLCLLLRSWGALEGNSPHRGY